MKNFLAFLVVALLELAATDAMGQIAPPTPSAPGVLAGFANLSVTASTGRVALPSTVTPYGAITIVNTGTKDAFFRFGTSTVTATTSTTPLAAGKHLTLWITDQTVTYLAAICAGSDSTTLVIYQGTGLLDFGP